MSTGLRTTRTRDTASGDVDERPFRFFELPREHRNAVYRYATPSEPLSFHTPGSQPSYCISGKCDFAALLVSRQYKAENEEETNRHAKLKISGDHSGGVLLEEFKRGSAKTSMRFLRHLTLCIRLNDDIEPVESQGNVH